LPRYIIQCRLITHTAPSPSATIIYEERQSRKGQAKGQVNKIVRDIYQRQLKEEASTSTAQIPVDIKGTSFITLSI